MNATAGKENCSRLQKFANARKRSTDSNWVMFRTEEAVSGGLPVELDLDVTVPHQATIQVRYRVTKTQSALSTADLKYTNTLTVDCPFNTVTLSQPSLFIEAATC